MEITSTISKHPLAIGIAVLIVALFAWFMSRGSSQSSDTGEVTFTGAGGTHATTDPGAVSIEQSRIAAGSQNLATLAALLSGENTTAAQERVASQQSSDALSASLANTSAALDSSLAATAAAKDAALARTAADITIAQGSQQEALSAASISSDLQKKLYDTELQIAKWNSDNENFRIQAQKDESRAAANASIVNGFVRVGEDVLRVFEPWTW